MAAIGRWLVYVILGWALDLARAYFVKRAARKQELADLKEENRLILEKLKEAKSEEERIKAGGDLLRRG